MLPIETRAESILFVDVRPVCTRRREVDQLITGTVKSKTTCSACAKGSKLSHILLLVPMAVPTPSNEGRANWPRSTAQRLRRGLWRAIQFLLLAVALDAAIVVVGLIPVNNDFKPAADGIEIFLTSNLVHADVVLPIRSDVIDWSEHFPASCFGGDTRHATHVAIGWGDKGFFLETPTWSDLRASTAVHALLWPSPTCLHVSLLRPESLVDSPASVRISPEQYAELVQFILASFKTDGELAASQITGESYGSNDAFFDARGAYHGLNTCNSRVGAAIRSAGVRAAWLTPMPRSVYLYLPRAED